MVMTGHQLGKRNLYQGVGNGYAEYGILKFYCYEIEPRVANSMEWQSLQAMEKQNIIFWKF